MLWLALRLHSFYLVFGKPSVMINNYRLKKVFLSLETPDELSLNEIVPFAWDAVYSFEPYASREQMEEILGFRDSSLRETVSEGMLQLVFVKDKRVVSCICGYADILGYSVDFSWEEKPSAGTGYRKVCFEDYLLFSAEKKGDIIYLTAEE